MFRRGDSEERHEAIEAREVRPVGQGGKEVTIVGQSARLEGNIVSAGSLQVDGQVKGKITAEGDVTLSQSSQVEADIHAENIVVAGRFRGNIVAKNRAELAKGGRVEGNVSSKSLVVSEGAQFSGQSIMGSSDGRADGSRAAQAPGTAPEQPEAATPAHGEAGRAPVG